MAWKYAGGFFRILKYFFITFSAFLTYLSSNITECIGCRHLVPLTPPTFFVRSFWNFTRAFRMAWRYACGFFQNPEIIFYHFFCIFNLDIFLVLILQKHIGSKYLDPVTPTSFKPILWNFTGGLKICMWLFQNLEIIFYHWFPASILR